MNLSDKDIAGDVLSLTKHSVTDLTWAALECSNTRLRRTLRQFRDHREQAQERIGQISSAHGWYLPSEPTDHRATQRVAGHFASSDVALGPGQTAGRLHPTEGPPVQYGGPGSQFGGGPGSQFGGGPGQYYGTQTPYYGGNQPYTGQSGHPAGQPMSGPSSGPAGGPGYRDPRHS